MKILYLSHGSTTHDRRFLSLLAGAGHIVSHLRLERDGASGWAPALDRAIAEIRPDLALAGPVPSAAFACARTGFRPFVAVAWGSDVLVETVRNEAARAKAQYALERASAVLCDCGQVSRRVRELAPVAPERIVEIPWGADLRRFFPGPVRSKSSTFTAISTRTWAPGYGLDTLLDAFAAAHAEEPRLRLSLCGGGPLAAEVAARIARHGIAASVVVSGRVPERSLANRYRAADVYISCAESDGSSVSLLQAMACGLPAVVTDWPSNREWVSSGLNGWLARAGDARSFAEALLAAARLDRHALGGMSRASAAIARGRADWRRNSRRLLAVCERLAEAA
jgi:glycosyltransferase involved in cell wall biosynthesis